MEGRGGTEKVTNRGPKIANGFHDSGSGASEATQFLGRADPLKT